MVNSNTKKGFKQALPFLSEAEKLLSKEGLSALKAFKAELQRGALTQAQIAAAFDFILEDLSETLKELEAEQKARSRFYISINEAAALLGKSRQALYQRIQRGTVSPGVVWRSKNGRKVKILAEKLHEFK